ncbi:MAG: DUF362 domain-containing protein [Bacteroidales bacterium]|nr:DUF362 domain-containing protein [Bacteroidales bacterium]
MKSKSINRREFIKGTTSAAIAGAVYMGSPASLLSLNADKTKVVLIRDKDVLDDLNKVNPDVISNMMDKAVTTLSGMEDPVDAWKKLIKPEDIVGIKSNVWNYLPTPSELEQYLKKRVMDCGVEEDKIGIKDRGVLNDPIFTGSTALINVRPFRTHYWSGVGSLLKNYIMFVNNPSAWHGDTCADLAKLWEEPVVKGKTRLNILVMLTPLFHGSGPHHFNPNYTWRYYGLIVGFDPVACDATGLRILQMKRNEFFGEESPVNPPAHHVAYAETRHKLGVADPNKIEVIKLGYEDDILI